LSLFETSSESIIAKFFGKQEKYSTLFIVLQVGQIIIESSYKFFKQGYIHY